MSNNKNENEGNEVSKTNNNSNNSKQDNQITEETIPIKKNKSKEDMDFEKMLNFVKLASRNLKDLNDHRRKKPQSTFHKKYTKDDIQKWMETPWKYGKQLRDLSRFLYDTSLHYRRLIDYFSTMLTFDYVVDLYNQSEFNLDEEKIKLIRNRYIEVINYLEIMNIKHEFQKIMSKAWVDDVVYGYEYSTNNSFFFYILDPDYCEITSIEDGCYNFSFDFKFFDKFPDELEKYGDEFKEKYDIYRKNPKEKRWIELDSKKTICIKISNSEYPLPPLSGIFEDIYSLYEYKDIQLSRTELENYLMLVAKIPYQNNKEDKENSFALSLDIAKEYYRMMEDNLPPQIGSILSPFEEVNSINLNKTEKDLDYVSKAEDAVYNSAGVPKLVFNSDNASGAALKKAVKFDENTVFAVLRQFERWVNRKLKDKSKRTNFKVEFLDITKDNRDEAINKYKEASTLGLPAKTRYCASIGLSPSDIKNGMFLENEVLGITENFVPLQSSHTQSGDNQVGDNQGGNPGVDDDELEPEGEDARDRDSNDPDNRDND